MTSAAFEAAVPVAAISLVVLGAQPASPKAANGPAAVTPFRKLRREYAAPVVVFASPAIFSMVMILSFSVFVGIDNGANHAPSIRPFAPPRWVEPHHPKGLIEGKREMD